MSPAATFLTFGLIVATVVSLGAWIRHRGPRSPLRSVDEFHTAMRALSPRGRRRG